MPSETEIYRRMAIDAEFASVIGRAREAQQDAEVERIVAMADDATPENWQVVKMRIWARQWRAGKLAPKKYGDKATVTHEGGDKPIQVADLSPVETARAIGFILREGVESAKKAGGG